MIGSKPVGSGEAYVTADGNPMPTYEFSNQPVLLYHLKEDQIIPGWPITPARNTTLPSNGEQNLKITGPPTFSLGDGTDYCNFPFTVRIAPQFGGSMVPTSGNLLLKKRISNSQLIGATLSPIDPTVLTADNPTFAAAVYFAQTFQIGDPISVPNGRTYGRGWWEYRRRFKTARRQEARLVQLDYLVVIVLGRAIINTPKGRIILTWDGRELKIELTPQEQKVRKVPTKQRARPR